ncbi:AAA family ATPase [Hyphomicrobium sp. DY-1]|uniref:bifunctional aminoglycoside phosphotransferase/ATP-binding protein n=1 Tax=Hyphomicrobium sp. DY-1 TaxID=3075650 RepID=UPI0039C360F1
MNDAIDEEAEVVALLSAAETYSLPRGSVDVIETHCARVFLAGDQAFKVKKRVKLPFLDFTILERRFSACRREIELNQPHAPTIYLGLRQISRRADGILTLENAGKTVDWAVHMRRFDQASVLVRIADRGPLPAVLPQKLAVMVANYHRSAPRSSADQGSARIYRLVEQLASELSTGGDLICENASTFSSLAHDHLFRNARLLDQRAASGALRRCHGDLHLGNIVMINSDPVPFDALEFDEELATTDVFYDLAFLLMDLDHRGLRAEANGVINGYVGEAPLGSEIDGLACLPLFLACRSCVRAVVSLERARQEQGPISDGLLREAQAFLTSSLQYLRPSPAIAIAIGGLSGSGKSTLGRILAPLLGRAPGAIHLRSDIERKRLAGVAEEHRLSRQYYTAETSKAVYQHLGDKSAATVASGHSVVTDAVFARPDERLAIEEAALRAGGRFLGFWLDAPEDQLTARVEARMGDASDATADVVRSQLKFDLGPISWHRLDASGDPRRVFEAAIAVLRAEGHIRDRPM